MTFIEEILDTVPRVYVVIGPNRLNKLIREVYIVPPEVIREPGTPYQVPSVSKLPPSGIFVTPSTTSIGVSTTANARGPESKYCAIFAASSSAVGRIASRMLPAGPEPCTNSSKKPTRLSFVLTPPGDSSAQLDPFFCDYLPSVLQRDDGPSGDHVVADYQNSTLPSYSWRDAGEDSRREYIGLKVVGQSLGWSFRAIEAGPARNRSDRSAGNIVRIGQDGFGDLGGTNDIILEEGDETVRTAVDHNVMIAVDRPDPIRHGEGSPIRSDAGGVLGEADVDDAFEFVVARAHH